MIDSFNSDHRSERKLYNSLVMTAYLMDTINPGHYWKQRLKDLVATHDIETSKWAFLMIGRLSQFGNNTACSSVADNRI